MWKDKCFRVWVEEEIEGWVPDCLGTGVQCRSEGKSPEQSSPVVRSADISDSENEECLYGNVAKEGVELCASVSKNDGENGSCMHGKSKGPSFPLFDIGSWLEEENTEKDKIYYFKSKKRSYPKRRRKVSGPLSSPHSPSDFLDSVEKGRPGKRPRAHMEDCSDPFSLDRLLNQFREEKIGDRKGSNEGASPQEGCCQ
ncbi:hypothetical protein Hanom_Chr01g00054251 [Helianthus anomalus]